MLRSLGRFIKYLLRVSATVFVAIFSLFMSVFVALLVLVAVGAGMAAGSSELDDIEHTTVYGDEDSDHKLAQVSINGLILGSQDEVSPLFSLFSDQQVAYGYEIKKQLEDLAEDDEIKGVLLQINSPGGTIYGSMAIADGVRAYREATNKPVYAYISSLGASGGYWAAVSADKVYADRGTSVGSVGVITGPFKYYKDVVSESTAFGDTVETEGGVSTQYFTAGKYKDLGNPYRDLSDTEKATLQESLDGSYSQFVSFVSQRRGVSEQTIREEWGALIYSDEQAKKLKLIDDSVAQEDAYQRLAAASGASGDDFQVVKELDDSSFFGALTGAVAQFAAHGSATTRFQFCGLKTALMVYEGDVRALCN